MSAEGDPLLMLAKLREWDADTIRFHGGVVYLYRIRCYPHRRGKHGWYAPVRRKWIASWFPLWPKDSYEIIAIAEVSAEVGSR